LIELINSMYSILESDLKELSQILDDAKSIGIDFLNNLNDLPTSIQSIYDTKLFWGVNPVSVPHL